MECKWLLLDAVTIPQGVWGWGSNTNLPWHWSDNKSRSILKTTVCLWSKTVSTKPCVKVKAWRSAPLHDSDSSVRCRRSSEVTLPCFTLRGTRVPTNISVPSAVLFTTLSSILLPLSAAASLYNLRQLVK